MALTTSDKKWLGSKFVTKDDLKQELKKLVTKEDLKNELSNYPNKVDLTATKISLGLEIDHKIDGLRDEMNEKHSEVMTSLDAIMKEVTAGREHDLVIVYQQDKQNERLDRLEKKTGIVTQF